jgi:2-furoyl-CoA dehydrogenase FAD binding subunit
MKPAAFDYYQPQSTDEALSVLAELGGEGKVLAGGQSLIPMLNMRLLKPAALIDISAINELDSIKDNGEFVEVGAAVTQEKLLKHLQSDEHFPLLRQTLPWVGHYQTRQRGTVCGSLVHSDPSSELPLCLAMLQGEVVLQKRKRKRVLSVAEFQTGILETAVEEGELLTAVRFPRSAKSSSFLFKEISQRHGDFAIVAIAVEAHADGMRIGVGGVADLPAVNSFPVLSGDEIDDALNDFAWELKGSDDVHASARYRRELVRRIGKSLIQELAT